MRFRTQAQSTMETYKTPPATMSRQALPQLKLHLTQEQPRLPAGDNMAAWERVSIIDNIFTNTSATNAYPITTMTYALLYENQNYAGFSAAQAAATINFLHWIVNGGQAFGPARRLCITASQHRSHRQQYTQVGKLQRTSHNYHNLNNQSTPYFFWVIRKFRGRQSAKQTA